MKVVRNDKDYVDQSLDEIKLLRFINCNGDVDLLHCLRLYDFFYYKEHLIIVTELLKCVAGCWVASGERFCLSNNILFQRKSP